MRYREKSTRSKDRESPILTKTETNTHRLKILGHHEEILSLLETKLILNVINYHVKVHWFTRSL